ncbi:MAG: hypothetical protein IJZ68_06255 [Bacteroidaceae bacterium]|nr:hypothetical protein [Bacteroidaceae bacterium]
MKKILSLVLALCLCLSLGVTAFAATVTEESAAQSANTTVTYGVEAGYTVTIPETVALNTEGKGQATVSAADVLLLAGKTLKVTVTGVDELVNTADNATTLSYKIGKTEGAADVVDGTVVLSVAAGNATGSQNLYFELTEDPTAAGTYSDTLTFTVTVE